MPRGLSTFSCKNSSVPVPTIVGRINASHLLVSPCRLTGGYGDILGRVAVLVYGSRLVTDRCMNQVFLSVSSEIWSTLAIVPTTLQELT
jgi:hypothetical protein